MPTLNIAGFRSLNTDDIASSELQSDGKITYTLDDDSTITLRQEDAETVQTALGEAPPVVSTTESQKAVAYETEYGHEDSFQVLAADLTLSAGAGTSDAGDTAHLAPTMGHVDGSTLTKQHNYIGGVIGKTSVQGAQSTILPHAAVLGIIGDGVSAADAIVCAHIDGDDPSTQTNANAAFGVTQANNHASSGVNYGLSLKFSPSAALNTLLSGTAKAFKIVKALFQSPNDVCILEGAGAPTNAVTGANFAGKGSLYIDYTNGKLYINTNTLASPTWTVVGTQS